VTAVAAAGISPRQRIDQQSELVSGGRSARKIGAMTPRDYALYATAVFCWGTSWLALRIQAVSAPPETAVFWRFVFATLIMLAWVLAARQIMRFGWREHRRFIAMGLGIFSTNFILYYHGGKVLTSGLLPVLFSLAVIGNLLLAALFLGQKITARLAGAAIAGVTGVALMFSAEFSGTADDARLAVGVALCTAGTISFCLGNLASALSSRAAVPVLAATAWGMIYGTCWTGIVVMLRGGSFAVPPTAAFALSLAWLVLVATILAFWAYLTLVQRIGPARAGYATVMFPVVGLIVSTCLESLVPGVSSNYTWTPLAFLGLALAIGGNALVLRR
jgi:drug/metabolite transporter (DMT)-like permease